MYTATRQGLDPRAAAAALRAFPERVIRYGTSIALTRTAVRANQAVVKRMSQVFDRPVQYTLNGTRVVPSTIETLSARVTVKDSGSGGAKPENYLLAQVEGGQRRQKRFERNLRFAGILGAGEMVVPAIGAPLDPFGNIARGEIQRILTALKASFDTYQNKTKSARSRRNAKRAPYFAVTSGGTLVFIGGDLVRKRSRLPGGIYRRDGRGQKMVFFFSKAQTYRPRLDFERVAEDTAREFFPAEFERAVDEIMARGR